MSQEQQAESNALDLSVNNSTESQSTESVQMVPVSEAIKYRKRAQAAEQQIESLSEQVEEHQQAHKSAQTRLAQSELENELTRQLVDAGVVDTEVALLLLHEQLHRGEDDPNINKIIQTMQQQRPYLFNRLANGSAGEMSYVPPGPTAGLPAPANGAAASLAKTAQLAQRSGSRKDMQEYLRMRRSIL